MEENVTSTEILELAIEKEKESFKFYKDAVKKVDNTNAKIFFELLAVEEQKHISKLEFELIKRGKVVTRQEEESLNMDDLDFVIEVTPESKEIYLDILSGAIQRERQSFKLYLNLYAATAAPPETRNTLEALIEEEIRHKMMLEIKYNHAANL